VSLYLLDTDHFSLYQAGNPRVVQQVLAHLTHRLATSVVTVEESLGGWMRVVSQARDDQRRAQGYARLARDVESLSGWSVLPFPAAALARHAALRRLRLNVGGNDLRIAAIALESGAIVVTRNRRDFGRVTGLVLEDWSV
jgi:tRNA(fMet)-specific endonuclease VapC